MELSLFDVLGPVMIGPSSSHTAGAARLADVARQIAGDFVRVSFGLYGSFARTYRGHGTDRALVAGVLGLSPQDDRLRCAFEIARERGLEYDFRPVHLEGAHENTVVMTFFQADGTSVEIEGASLGGGRIRITRIDDYPAEITADAPTLVILQKDQQGMVSHVTQLLAERNINIAVMRVSRSARGEIACCVIEVDGDLPEGLVERAAGVPGVLSARAVR